MTWHGDTVDVPLRKIQKIFYVGDVWSRATGTYAGYDVQNGHSAFARDDMDVFIIIEDWSDLNHCTILRRAWDRMAA